MSGALYSCVQNHVVQGRIIFPGTGYLEMARAAVEAKGLGSVFFLQPLAVESPGLFIECVVSDGSFEVRSGNADAVDDATVHCAGSAGAAGAAGGTRPAPAPAARGSVLSGLPSSAWATRS